jgi:hypothetical protein
MNWFKKKKQAVKQVQERPVIPSATELKAIIASKEQKRLDVHRAAIAEHFKEGNHPYKNLSYYAAFSSLSGKAYAYNNQEFDKLIPELEALGYVVEVKIHKENETLYRGADAPTTVTREVEYREIRMKD